MKVVKPLAMTDAMFVSSTAPETDYTAWSATTLYAVADNVMLTTSVHRNYRALLGKKATVTMTIASPGVVTWAAHGLAADTPVVFTTTGALPTGLVAGTTYYVRTPAAGTFEVSATAGGASINTTGSQSGVHTSGLASNYNQSPATNALAWLDLGPTNRWAMFDTEISTQSALASPLTVVIKPGYCNSLALFGLEGTTLVVTVRDALAGSIVYSRTVALDGTVITDWYQYYWEPSVQLGEVVLTELPPYADAHITITITGSATVKCGICAVGTFYTLGDTQYGATAGIIDYSRKETDVFGVTDFVRRAYSKQLNLSMVLDNVQMNKVQRVLADVRATPCAWIGTDEAGFEPLTVFGFYRDFSIDVAYPTSSYCSLEIEGLT